MGALAGLVEKGLMAADWAEALGPVEREITTMGQFLRAEIAAGRQYQPAGERVFAAFARPLADVRVLIVGQDPYPNPAHPIGLSFAVRRDVRPLPPSLRNIYAELQTDLGIPPAEHGDLSAWADHGVMLLNRSLTVRPGESNSHRGKGWEPVTERAITALSERAAAGQPVVAILWGSDARRLAPLLEPIPAIESPHPSPLSAHRGFFGSRPFSRANDLLTAAGADPIDWTLA